MTIDETRFAWVYPALAVAALLFLLLVPTARAVPRSERPKYHLLQVVTLLGAAVGAKLSMLAGDLGWPWTPLAGGWHEVFVSGRSITGGLVGGFLAAEAAKLPLRYRAPPNDAFAAKLPFSIALGRIGCLLGGCCRGVPTSGRFAVTYSDGVPRVPAQLIEMGWQLGMGVLLVVLLRRGRLQGRLFALYLAAYGVFRFATEPFRVTPKPWGGFSVYQALAVTMVILGLTSFVARSRGTATREALA